MITYLKPIIFSQYLNTTFTVILVQSPSCVQLFMTPGTTVYQASLSPTISQSLPKFMSIETIDNFKTYHETIKHILETICSLSLKLMNYRELEAWIPCEKFQGKCWPESLPSRQWQGLYILKGEILVSLVVNPECIKDVL